jgi:ADP-ribose pyrophosphatase YjhB (NUDIX family)
MLRVQPAVKVMAIVHRPRDGALLVTEDADKRGRRYQRPPGGSVEYGEQAIDAIRREFREELGVELSDVESKGVLENVFRLDDETRHEIVFVFRARLFDESDYEGGETRVRDHPTVRVLWRSPTASDPPLYPAGIHDFM